MTTENTDELHNLDNNINVINQFKKWKRPDVDATLNQIVKINACVDITKDFLAAHLSI